MRSAKKTTGAHEGWVLHVSVSCISAQRKTETHVLSEIATEALFLLVVALRSPELRCFGRFTASRTRRRVGGYFPMFRRNVVHYFLTSSSQRRLLVPFQVDILYQAVH
jgi:hypothetical protein